MDDDLGHLASEERLDGPTSIRSDEPTSLINMVGDAVKTAIENIPAEYFDLEEHNLRRRAQPTAVDYALRVAFWCEFERVQTTGSGKMVTARIYSGVCVEQYFYQKFLKNPLKVMWMVTPMRAYKREMEALLHYGQKRLREAMAIPFKTKGKRDKNGKLKPGEWIPKNVTIFLGIMRQVENRAFGMAVQRTEKKETKVNKSLRVTAKIPAAVTKPTELEAQIRQLEAELGATTGENKGSAAVIDHPALPPADGDVGGGASEADEVRDGAADGDVREADVVAAATLSFKR